MSALPPIEAYGSNNFYYNNSITNHQGSGMYLGSAVNNWVGRYDPGSANHNPYAISDNAQHGIYIENRDNLSPYATAIADGVRSINNGLYGVYFNASTTTLNFQEYYTTTSPACTVAHQVRYLTQAVR
jgi:hypothetical protein